MIELSILNQLSPGLRELFTRILLAILAFALIWVMRRFIVGLFIRPLRSLFSSQERLSAGTLLIDVVDAPLRLLVAALGVGVAGVILTIDGTTSVFIANLARSLVIVACFMALYRAVDLVIVSSDRVRRVTGITLDEQLVPFIRTAFKIVLLAMVLIVLLQEWDYDVNGLVAGLGLGGLAFSLAAQDTVANLFAFSTIVTDRPFMVGEYIKTPDVEGTVVQVGSRSTRIRRVDHAYVTIPNAKLAASPILNWSRLTKRRLEFTLGVTYGTSASQIRVLVARLHEMLLAQEKVDVESVLVRFLSFGDSSLDVLVIAEFYEPKLPAFRAITEQVNLNIMDIVEDLGLSIAFPSLSLYIENVALSSNGNPPQFQRPADSSPPRPDHAEALPRASGDPSVTEGASPRDEFKDDRED